MAKCGPLRWYERYSQLKRTRDSQSLIDDVKATYLKILVTGKAKTAIAEFTAKLQNNKYAL